jgi:hypothetical protein
MKRLGLIIGLGLGVQICFGQSSLKELTNLLDLGQYKLQAHLQKKGYKRTYAEDEGISYVKEEGKKHCIRGFQIINMPSECELVYQTTSFEEYSNLKQEIKSSGFNYPSKADENGPVLYQRESIRIESTTKKNDSTVFYVLKAAKKNLPRKKDLMWAEDLLQFDSQEYLADVFGKENLKTDLFYYTETETNKCTVLFPNTNQEVIFIWNDEMNLKDLSFILIGGNLRPKDVDDNRRPVAHNVWRSKQGIQCGMSLNEMQMINEQPVRFYNWNAESAGYLAPNNKGKIDFSQLGIVFNCLNCSFLKVTNNTIIDSESAMNENQKVYVTSYIVLPPKKTEAYSGTR